MQDSMWQKVEVDYGDKIVLILEDQSKIEDQDLIIAILKDNLSFQEKLNNASNSLKKIIKSKIGGERVLASNEEITKRRNICKECPFNQRSFYGRVCSECGCNIKAKTSFLTEHCPKEKW